MRNDRKLAQISILRVHKNINGLFLISMSYLTIANKRLDLVRIHPGFPKSNSRPYRILLIGVTPDFSIKLLKNRLQSRLISSNSQKLPNFLIRGDLSTTHGGKNIRTLLVKTVTEFWSEQGWGYILLRFCNTPWS